jgi:hypothetical protein
MSAYSATLTKDEMVLTRNAFERVRISQPLSPPTLSWGLFGRSKEDATQAEWTSGRTACLCHTDSACNLRPCVEWYRLGT